MQYRSDKYGNPVSILGFGCMRFKRKGGKIDYEKAEKEILNQLEIVKNGEFLLPSLLSFPLFET